MTITTDQQEVLEVLAKNKKTLKEWCECGGSARNTIFFKDNFFHAVKKHHYRCDDCGGIQQIG